MTQTLKHFLNIRDIPASDLRHIMDEAHRIKAERKAGTVHTDLQGKKLAMIFEKSSTRTRTSFEVGMVELGGYPLNLSANDMQIGRGESIADTARVMSRFVDGIMMRANEHESLEELARHAGVPIINGLTDLSHPCQLMADVMTIEEHLGNIEGKTIAWIGDGNNVANSFIAAAVKFNFKLVLSCPKKFLPSEDYINWAEQEKPGLVSLNENPQEAVVGADVVVTDTWVSMGDTNADERMELLEPYQVNSELMELANEKAIFMHCLPAHRGEEVTAGVIDGPQSVVWDEAENRLHAQKAVLCWCMA